MSTVEDTDAGGETLAPGIRSPRPVQVGDVAVDDVSFNETVRLIATWATEGSGGYVCTPNVDHVVKARSNGAFRRAVAGARLRVPDGMWIVYASRLAGRPLRETVTGRLLPQAVGVALASEGRTIGLFGGIPGVAEEAGDQLRRRGILVADAFGPSGSFSIGSDEDLACVRRLCDVDPAVLFVALGAPKQELWMAAHTADLSSTVLVGVGAAVDVLAGRRAEAPRWMTRTGLEWAFRLAHEPRRLARRYLIDDPWILWWALRTRFRSREGRGEHAAR